jgi:type I restriction enzyme, R subunit
MTNYNLVAATNESTVVAEYTEYYQTDARYQTEADLEREFIALLVAQGYERLPLRDEAALVANLRSQLARLNDYSFSDSEWQRFYATCIANPNEGITDKTRKIQTDHIQVLQRDDGSSKNILLIDKKHIHNNRLQVINQYSESAGTHQNRYDVTILVNGLPLIHAELKRRGVAIREAFNQIKRYQRDSFWAASGLFQYVQLFIISNGTRTKYYSNTTRVSHIKEATASAHAQSKKTSNSFEFTSFWADATNKQIMDLMDVTRTLLTKHTILNVLTKYCVYTSEELLLVMRPYQIAATERILSRIDVAHNYKQSGTRQAGGYIWHTTGSGKTLTSFKTAQLAAALPHIDKVLFVVDRKDLDYQTMREYDRFEPGAANSNSSTRVLQQQLENDNARIIITTIQKLDSFVSSRTQHPVYQKKVVIIFDECHRSQFGLMHAKIVKAFKHYYLFGFTGTPIFAENAPSGRSTIPTTTTQTFGDRLHAYTIVDAISDQNVLPFKVDFANTIKSKADIVDKQVSAIDTERALADPARISAVVSYILTHFAQKTLRNTHYTVQGQRLTGFNSILAATSIPVAMQYYNELKKQQADRTDPLKVAIIFSYNANETEVEDSLPEEQFDTDKLPPSARDFLTSAISDYNGMFKTNFDTSADRFQNYYKDISMRMKNRQIDLLVVVNMFLTGFDATTLNTLWVDKNLRQHGLIQAFSRTNRILNAVKTFGNIVCFRDLQQATEDAIALFGNKEASSIVLLKDYAAYYHGYTEDGKQYPGYAELIARLEASFPINQHIVGESAQNEFIMLFGMILRQKNILRTFDEFVGNEILTERDMQNYQSMYIDLYQDRAKPTVGERESIIDDVVFEIELIRQVEITIDYILNLVKKFQATKNQDSDVRGAIEKAISASIQLRSKKALIDSFIATVNTSTDIPSAWPLFVEAEMARELTQLIATEALQDAPTRQLLEYAFRDGTLKTSGTDFDSILPPMSRFSGMRETKKQHVVDLLSAFFEKYAGVVRTTQ